MRLSTATVEPARKGGRPVARAYRTLPRLKRSLRASRVSPRACSGDMYCGVPATTPLCVRLASSTARARPKSLSLTRSGEEKGTRTVLINDLGKEAHSAGLRPNKDGL